MITYYCIILMKRKFNRHLRESPLPSTIHEHSYLLSGLYLGNKSVHYLGCISLSAGKLKNKIRKMHFL